MDLSDRNDLPKKDRSAGGRVRAALLGRGKPNRRQDLDTRREPGDRTARCAPTAAPEAPGHRRQGSGHWKRDWRYLHATSSSALSHRPQSCGVTLSAHQRRGQERRRVRSLPRGRSGGCRQFDADSIPILPPRQATTARHWCATVARFWRKAAQGRGRLLPVPWAGTRLFP